MSSEDTAGKETAGGENREEEEWGRRRGGEVRNAVQGRHEAVGGRIEGEEAVKGEMVQGREGGRIRGEEVVK